MDPTIAKKIANAVKKTPVPQSAIPEVDTPAVLDKSWKSKLATALTGLAAMAPQTMKPEMGGMPKTAQVKPPVAKPIAQPPPEVTVSHAAMQPPPGALVRMHTSGGTEVLHGGKWNPMGKISQTREFMDKNPGHAAQYDEAVRNLAIHRKAGAGKQAKEGYVYGHIGNK